MVAISDRDVRRLSQVRAFHVRAYAMLQPLKLTRSETHNTLEMTLTSSLHNLTIALADKL